MVFNEGLCRVVEQYVKKGAKLYIEGALQTRKWQGQDGQDRYSTEVVLQGFNSVLTMLDARGGLERVPAPACRRTTRPATPPPATAMAPSVPRGGGKSFDKPVDDEIPF